MTLIKYKNPTEYSFYKWIKKYPNSKYWIERIKKHPNLKLNPLLETPEFYKFVKTACQNRALTWLNWSRVEKIILKEISILKKGDLKELKNIFGHLVSFYEIPALKQGFSGENSDRTKRGYYIERGVKDGNFYEKESPTNLPKGGILKYDNKTKEYKKLI